MADSLGFANQRKNDSRWQTGAFAMGQPIAVRTDYTVAEVRLLAKQAKDAAQARRLLAIAAVLDGSSRTEAATNAGMDPPDVAGLGDPFQRAGAGRSGQHSFARYSP